MKRFIVIACEATALQAQAVVEACGNEVDITVLTVGLHAMGQDKMPAELQKAIDTVDASRYDAILLAYGLCNNGIVGLHADIPLVAPRAHDCITLFMGSKEKYRQYFDTHPGTMFVSAGTLNPQANQELYEGVEMREKMRQDLLKKYDEEEVDYLMESSWGNPLKNYHRFTFINDGVGEVESNRKSAQDMAAFWDWEFDEFVGSQTLFDRLLSGDWSESDFLVVEPGSTIKPSYTEDVIQVVSVELR
jgi:hypothetical protein